jgi:hypothetical protein
VYAPLLRRDVKAYVDAAPKELGQRAQPILTRARDAVKTLRGLGLSGDDISRLADAAGQAVGSEASPDGVTVRAQLLEQLQEKVPADRLSQAAVVFSAGQSDPAGLLDLGFVPPEVGAAAGFDCNVQATI